MAPSSVFVSRASYLSAQPNPPPPPATGTKCSEKIRRVVVNYKRFHSLSGVSEAYTLVARWPCSPVQAPTIAYTSAVLKTLEVDDNC